MTERYLGWRAGALAVVGCALGALLASPPAQAQSCVGDCNDDGMVAINELIIGVNIALDSQPVSACTSFDVNNDGMVTINELILGVNNALNGCSATATPTEEGDTPTPTEAGDTATPTEVGDTPTPTEAGDTATPTEVGDTPTPTEAGDTPTPTEAGDTPTPTEVGDTPTPTEVGDTPSPTLPAGTATATITNTIPIAVNTATATAPTGEGSPTPTATEAPTAEPLGHNVCTLDSPADKSKSLLFLQTALALSLVPSGTYSIDCGVPGADGTAPCSCELLQFDVVVIPSIGDVCINPAPDCEPGKIDCNGGSEIDVELTADHNIGTCDSDAACATACETHCTGLGAGFARQSYGCEGHCQGGPNNEADCSRDSQCTGGQCPGGEPVTHFDKCNCVCAATNIGAPSVAGGLTCNIGTQINVELPSNGHCGDTVSIHLAPVCGGVTSETSTGIVLTANNDPTKTIPAAGPSVVDGVAVSCENFTAHNITGLKLVGQLGFFDSTLGDIRSGNTFVCQ